MVRNSHPYFRSPTDHLQSVAYIAAVPVAEANKSGQLLAAKFFTAVFGYHAGARVLPVFVALPAFGNLVSANHGCSVKSQDKESSLLAPSLQALSPLEPLQHLCS